MKLREFRHYWGNLKHPSGSMSLGLGSNQCIGYSSIYEWWIADVTPQHTRQNITNIESKEAVKLLVGVLS